MSDKTILRMNMLGGMNAYVLDYVADENLIDMWLMCGVPDGATEDDIKEMAEDDNLWVDAVNTFKRIINESDI